MPILSEQLSSEEIKLLNNLRLAEGSVKEEADGEKPTLAIEGDESIKDPSADD